jgi:vacuolar-type H+-ATPase subunit I/STV1
MLATQLRSDGAGSDEIWQVLELASVARKAAARSYSRDSHGRFAKLGAVVHAVNASSLRETVRQLPRPAALPEDAPVVPEHLAKIHQELRHGHILARAKAESAQAQIEDLKKQQAETQKQIHQLMGAVRRANQKIAELSDKKEHQLSKKRLAVHAGTLLAGGALTAATGGMAAPAFIAAAVATGPALIQELVDFFKRLG